MSTSSRRMSRMPLYATVDKEGGIIEMKCQGSELSTAWELDVYSRPVLVDGKKLWEVLLTSSDSNMRFVRTLPSNAVNSKAVRDAVESCIEEVGERGGDCKVRAKAKAAGLRLRRQGCQS